MGGFHLALVEVDGFKSFTRPTSVTFCPHFTVVTGPNGSGKSNVLDAQYKHTPASEINSFGSWLFAMQVQH